MASEQPKKPLGGLADSISVKQKVTGLTNSQSPAQQEAKSAGTSNKKIGGLAGSISAQPDIAGLSTPSLQTHTSAASTPQTVSTSLTSNSGTAMPKQGHKAAVEPKKKLGGLKDSIYALPEGFPSTNPISQVGPPASIHQPTSTPSVSAPGKSQQLTEGFDTLSLTDKNNNTPLGEKTVNAVLVKQRGKQVGLLGSGWVTPELSGGPADSCSSSTANTLAEHSASEQKKVIGAMQRAQAELFEQPGVKGLKDSRWA